jgi:hypothetical protein
MKNETDGNEKKRLREKLGKTDGNEKKRMAIGRYLRLKRTQLCPM